MRDRRSGFSFNLICLLALKGKMLLLVCTFESYFKLPKVTLKRTLGDCVNPIVSTSREASCGYDGAASASLGCWRDK